MMFEDGDYKIKNPKFFVLSLTDEKGNSSFLYCLKFSEKYNINEAKESKAKKVEKDEYSDVPLVFYIKSSKEDSEAFKQLFFIIIQINKKGEWFFPLCYYIQ